MNAELTSVTLADLQAHPDNPRLAVREDVVDAIAREVAAQGFGAEHAILVQRINGGYRIVSGHHRAEGARRAGLQEIPAWVRDMTDDEAFMALVLANAQGELDPLEIGMHALTYDTARGRKGEGLAAYAERIGRAKQRVSDLRAAAEVVQRVRISGHLLGRAYHLHAVSRAPEVAWQPLVEALVAQSWSVADTEREVATVRRFAIPPEYETWLPLTTVVTRHLEGEGMSPATVAGLVRAAQAVDAWLDEHGSTADRLAYWEWRQADGNGWRAGAHDRYLAELQRRDAEAREGWHHGDWRDFVGGLDDESVALVLTDPPYGVAYQSNRRAERHAALAGDDMTAGDELRAALDALVPKLATNAHVFVFTSWKVEVVTRAEIEGAGLTVRGSLIWDKTVHGSGDLEGAFAPRHERVIHAVKGTPKLYARPDDVLAFMRPDMDRHPTEKPVELLRVLIEATTAEGAIVADPFAGVASTLVAARESKRDWWGCEIAADFYAIGTRRLRGDQ